MKALKKKTKFCPFFIQNKTLLNQNLKLHICSSFLLNAKKFGVTIVQNEGENWKLLASCCSSNQDLSIILVKFHC